MGNVVGLMSGLYECSELSMSAEPIDTHYRFVCWTLNGDTVSYDNTLSLLLNTDYDVVAHFGINVHYIETDDNIYINVIPNPVDGEADVVVQLNEYSYIDISIVDLSGVEMINLVSGYKESGEHRYGFSTDE
jgi:hypothetical protein